MVGGGLTAATIVAFAEYRPTPQCSNKAKATHPQDIVDL